MAVCSLVRSEGLSEDWVEDNGQDAETAPSGTSGSQGVGCVRPVGFMVSAAPALKVISCPMW